MSQLRWGNKKRMRRCPIVRKTVFTFICINGRLIGYLAIATIASPLIISEQLHSWR